jgi:hypothetical protein
MRPGRGATRVQPSLTRGRLNAKKYGALNVHAARAALRVFSDLNSTQSALQQKKI